MRLEITPTKIVPDAITVWNEQGEADVIMDLKNLTFRDNYFDEIFVFHVVDHLFEDEIKTAMLNWRRCLKVGGRIFICVDDFEHIARGFVGGDITIDQINKDFSHPVHVTRDNLLKYFTDAGFLEGSVIIWHDSPKDAEGRVLMPKLESELILHSTKHE